MIRVKSTISVTNFATDIVGRSFQSHARGYLAGLHSYQSSQEGKSTEAEFESFDSAWEAIQSVPEDLLKEFEDELWETQSRRFVYGTKEVSVIDEIETKANSNSDVTQPQDAKVIRYLVLNERPNLIQTAVEVPEVGAPYEHYHFDEKKQMVARPPSPISQTHLCGLAMALPFWNKANPTDDSSAEAKIFNPPSCLLIGAGGCSLAHTLAANLFLKEYNEKFLSGNQGTDEEQPQSIERPGLAAVEACPEILQASTLWFGAGNEGDDSKKVKARELQPPFFDLVQSTGESYLESLIKSLNAKTATDGPKHPSLIDLLIIDAEDGSAPPKSMRTHEFWKKLVLPCLNRDQSPVIGVNSIGTKSETNDLINTVEEVLGGDYTILVLAPPPEAMVTDRHKLIFALPKAKIDAAAEVACWSLSKDELTGYVDAPEAWAKEISVALKETFAKDDF